MTEHSDQTTTDQIPPSRGATHVLLSILDQLESKARPDPDAAPIKDAPAAKAKADKGPTATLGDLLEALDERAFGLLILILALPCCLPFVYILPQIVALPILFLAGQLALGKTSPWLIDGLRERAFPINTLKQTVGRAAKYLGWAERLVARRLTFLTRGIGVRIVGALLLIPAASILVPLPMTNTMPGIGVAIVALGLIERDGLAVLGGLIIGLIWVGLLVFLGAEGLSLLIDWIKAHF